MKKCSDCVELETCGMVGESACDDFNRGEPASGLSELVTPETDAIKDLYAVIALLREDLWSLEQRVNSIIAAVVKAAHE